MILFILVCVFFFFYFSPTGYHHIYSPGLVFCINMYFLAKPLLNAPTSQFIKRRLLRSCAYDGPLKVLEVISQVESAVKDRARQLRSFTLF